MNLGYIYALIAAILSAGGDILYNENIIKKKIKISDFYRNSFIYNIL